MRITQTPNQKFSRILKVCAPAILMPLLFSAIPALIMGNDELLRLSWSVIAPSSLLGTIVIVYIPLFAQRVGDGLRSFPRFGGAVIAGCSIALLVHVFARAAIFAQLLPESILQDVSFSAGIGAFVAVLTSFKTTELERE